MSSVLGALLLGQQAGLLQEAQGADPDVVAAYVEAVDALRGMTAVEHALGELALGLGTAYHELAASREDGSGLLVEAVRCYHLALRILKAPEGRPQERPERYAFAHSNLALCYLAMPMTGRPRQAPPRGRRPVAARGAEVLHPRGAPAPSGRR